MSLLKPPNPMAAHPPQPPLPRYPFLGCESLAEAEADIDSDSEQERPQLDDEDAAIDVEADEEQESQESPGIPSKGGLCLDSKEHPGQHKEAVAPAADKSANQKAY
ncbi:uncharacterized protein LOC108031103 [Drosophila biarmipes]|uniref:uncharacterized protein LOC108031103 n=1 Tax=Drosophila biarmipes TaxID=125945 RepID=UPI0007E7415D|nr:uncharacterized protein LOC108031103 [Drosophila biarmipes]